MSKFVGTNDIKHYRVDNGRGRRATPGSMGKFKAPLEILIRLIRQTFGHNVEICLQSVLPMKCMYTYTGPNFNNFNSLLMSICRNLNCTFLDWFSLFLNEQGSDFDKAYYSDNVHLNRSGYNILHKCLKGVIDSVKFRNYHNSYT